MLSREPSTTRKGQHAALAREVLVTVQAPGNRAVAVEEVIIAEAAALALLEAAARIRSLVLDPIVVLAMVHTTAVGKEDLALALVAIRLARVIAQAEAKARTVVKDLDPALVAFRPSKVEAQGGERQERTSCVHLHGAHDGTTEHWNGP